MATYKIEQNDKNDQQAKQSVNVLEKLNQIVHSKYALPLSASVVLLILAIVFPMLLLGNRSQPSLVPGSGSGSNQKSPSTQSTGKANKITSGASGAIAAKTYTISSQTYNAVTQSISKKNVTQLRGYYASAVHIVDLFSKVNVYSGTNQAEILIASSLDGATSPWNWQIPASELSSWQNGQYGQYFTGNDLVGISQNGYVLSIVFDSSGQVDQVFIAPIETLSPGSTPDSSNSQTSDPQQANPIQSIGGGD